MAPSPPIASQLRQLIYYHLDNNLLKNALFLAQRLIAYDPRGGEAAYLLAQCQLQSGYTKAAYDTSRQHALRGSHLGCGYVFAEACLELGRHIDGLTALDKCQLLWQNRNTWNQHNESRRQHLPDAAAVLCLKGKLWKAHKNMDRAVECWATALKLNPFMWDAFMGLSESGAKVSVPNIYKLSPEMVNMVHMAQRHEEATLPMEKPMPSQQQPSAADPFVSVQKPNGLSNHGSSVLFEKLNNSKASVNTMSTVLDEESVTTPSTIVDMDDSMLQNRDKHWEASNAPARKARNAAETNADASARLKTGSSRLRTRAKAGPEDPAVLQDPPPPGPPTKRTFSGQATTSSQPQPNGSEPSRRSMRLLSTRPPSANATSKLSSFTNSVGLRESGREIRKAKAPTVKPRSTASSMAGRVISGSRTKASGAEQDYDAKDNRYTASTVGPLLNHKLRTEPSQAEKDVDALRTLLDLFCRLASAQLALSNYDCTSSIQICNSLPSAQRETPYVLAQIGKAHYEQSQYAEAEKYFIRVRQLAPSTLEDMEVYSTTLWHLKSEIELAYLAHELSEIEHLSPQAWCAIGNSFSLQREHEQALKCFRRATQLDPAFAYGFTLQGHEYIANEEFEKALDAYRSAIAADNRHYNAWYGLGKVYERMGKWSVAEQHYRTAARINPTNAVLICCIGLVLEKLRQPERALECYSRACKIAPKNALARFKKAKCLMTLQQPEKALGELEILKDVAPEEANVWFLMGRLYKMTRRKQEAVRAFTVALNLDPKAAQYIKDAMESLDDEDEMVDDDDDID